MKSFKKLTLAVAVVFCLLVLGASGAFAATTYWVTPGGTVYTSPPVTKTWYYTTPTNDSYYQFTDTTPVTETWYTSTPSQVVTQGQDRTTTIYESPSRVRVFEYRSGGW